MNTDAYVTSAKRIHLSIVLLAVTAAYFGWLEYEKREDLDRLYIIDKSLLVYRAIQSLENNKEEMTELDLGNFFHGARLEYNSDLRTIRYLGFSNKEPRYREYLRDKTRARNSNVIQNSYIIENQRLISRPGVVCSLAVFSGSGENVVHVTDYLSFRYAGSFSAPHVHLVFTSLGCHSFIPEDPFILISGTRNQPWFLALPNEDFEKLSIRRRFETNDSRLIRYDREKFHSHLSKNASQHIRASEEFKYLTDDELKREILNITRHKTGRLYKFDDLDQAIDALFEQKISRTSVFGVEIRYTLFVILMPIFFIILYYLLGRRLLLISESNLEEISEPWIFIRIDNTLDVIVCYFSIILLVMLSLFPYANFSFILDKGFFVFGHLFHFNPFPNIMKITSVLDNEITIDYMGTVLFISGIYFQFYFSYIVAVRFHSIVWRQSQDKKLVNIIKTALSAFSRSRRRQKSL